MSSRTLFASAFLAACAATASAKPPTNSGGDGSALSGSAAAFDVAHGNSGFDRHKVIPNGDGSLPLTTKSDDEDDGPPKLTDDSDPPGHSGHAVGSLAAAANDLASLAANLPTSDPNVRLSFPVKDRVTPSLALGFTPPANIPPGGGTIPAPTTLMILSLAAAAAGGRRRR